MNDIEKDFQNILEQNALEKVNDRFYLTKVLEKNNIPYKSCNSMSELLFLLSDISDEDEFFELEMVAKEIEEFHYYNEVNK